MSPLTSDLDIDQLPTLSTNTLAPFSSANTTLESLQSSSSIGRYIVPHLSKETYVWAWFEECLEFESMDGYRPGGYHPTLIGDKFNNDTYVVINKLGLGDTSTVWLAKNTLIDGEYVALKILTAEATKTTIEHNIIAHLQSKSNPKHPGHPYVASSLGSFGISGPNGYHLCLISEVVGGSLRKCVEEGSPMWYFPIKTSRAIAAQVILGVAYLHSLGICHGDLNVCNILLQRPFHGLPVEEINNRYGTPVKIALHRADGAAIGPEAPSYVVVPMSTFLPSHELTNCQVKISDFGSAFMVGHEPKNNENATAAAIVASPELLFGEKLTLPIDIWSLGCMLYEIISSQPLFYYFLGGEDEHIEKIVELLGPFPGPLWERWAGKEKYFTKVENRIVGSDFGIEDLGYCISHMRDLDETSETFQITKAETASLKALLSVMLVYRPSGRISLDGVLISDYMKNWAEPALVESLGKDISEL